MAKGVRRRRAEGYTYITNVVLDHVRLWIAQRVIEAVHANSIAIKSIFATVDGENGRSGVGLGHAPVALHNDQFGPYFIVNLFPFVENFQYVVLQ